MVKGIIGDAAEQSSGVAYSLRSMEKFEGIVFKRLPATEDFSCSEAIVLPGQHTAEAAWSAVRGALVAGGTDLIGGEIRLCSDQPAD